MGERADRDEVDAGLGVGADGAEGDAAGHAKVVLLHEHAVVEARAVVATAAAADGVLLQRPQTGRRLARVEDRRSGALGQLDEAAREGSDAAETGEEVERDSFAAE